ncbi:uncharacterized protein LOC128633092 isoform X1 [Ictalurus punctatus]|uniref:Uncharacterized protein LOC128633092 isoform X1 n=1 Tax=Ictalurus punctatus TaxID=7998 RepID=A0A9F7RLN5_ICTPU|nr:uncharacterized protein LOC128633092 isoform X1 [Ictalurus punctatus]
MLFSSPLSGFNVMADFCIINSVSKCFLYSIHFVEDLSDLCRFCGEDINNSDPGLAPAWPCLSLSDISVWKWEHHLKLNLAKTELLVIPACPSINHNRTVQLGSTTLKPTRTTRNLGVILDDSLTFIDHISTTARSCRFILYNIKKIRPYLTEQATQQLFQVLVISKLDCYKALRSGLPASSIKHFQMIQNAAARLVFNQPKKTHVTPLFISLHWLPVAACIKFKALMLMYKTLCGTTPYYLNTLPEVYVPSRNLRSIND